MKKLHKSLPIDARGALLAASFLFLPVGLHAYSSGSGTQDDPYMMTRLDTTLNISGAYYATNAQVNFGSSSTFYVGYSSTGVYLTIKGGYTIVDTTGYIGFGTGSSGTVTVTSSAGASSWSTEALYVGYLGSGTLNITDGGTVVTGNDSESASYIGYSTSSAVTITGYLTADKPSKWYSYGDITISSSSTLYVGDGAYVTDKNGYINNGSTATVTGSGSKWTNTATLYVGNSGAGTLNVEDSASVSSTNNLYVGSSGTGTLNVTTSGTISNVSGLIGNSSGSKGTATVTGTGSKWTNSGALFVGNAGTGALTISNGGSVSNTTGYIGDNSYHTATGTGTVIVTGSTSTWTNSDALSIGASGTGTLTISDKALVTTTTLSVGTNGKLYIDTNGYLLLSSTDETTDYNTLYSLISDGKVYYGTSTSSVLLTTGNYTSYVTLAYYSDITTCSAVYDVYSTMSGSYTVLLGISSAVPEPATYALFSGVGALGLALLRRKRKKA